MNYEEVISRLRALGKAEHRDGMAHFGISTGSALGISIPELRRLAREVGRDHDLAGRLWASGIHEARILATLIDVPSEVSEEQMERWAADFDSWDIVDGACGNLFDRTRWAWDKAMEWSRREEEYVKRAAFALMAYLAIHDKKAGSERFVAFLPVIEREAWDGRNFVKKAVNWALRQIGKRDFALNAAAIESARRILAQGSAPARWIARDALRELEGAPMQARLAASSKRAAS
ncbi:MAG: DNA alkylation repair protein [Dehalococcoidia bacterium]